MSAFNEAVVDRTRKRGAAFRKNEVTAIDTSGDVTIYTIAGRPMPMVQGPATIAVGTIVAWVDQDDPYALGPLRTD